ncbi:hypothetical protein DNTS_023512, partial [Danionella cerebrum]
MRGSMKMENDGPGKRWHCLKTTANVTPLAISLGSFAFCILLSVRSSDINSRIVDLEAGSRGWLLSPFHGISVDRLNVMVQERVDELLSQVCNRFQQNPQLSSGPDTSHRSYEHMARIRAARQVSQPDCNCPPGNAHIAQRLY